MAPPVLIVKSGTCLLILIAAITTSQPLEPDGRVAIKLHEFNDQLAKVGLRDYKLLSVLVHILHEQSKPDKRLTLVSTYAQDATDYYKRTRGGSVAFAVLPNHPLSGLILLDMFDTYFETLQLNVIVEALTFEPVATSALVTTPTSGTPGTTIVYTANTPSSGTTPTISPDLKLSHMVVIFSTVLGSNVSFEINSITKNLTMTVATTDLANSLSFTYWFVCLCKDRLRACLDELLTINSSASEGRFECDPANGKKICRKGWSNPVSNCSVRVEDAAQKTVSTVGLSTTAVIAISVFATLLGVLLAMLFVRSVKCGKARRRVETHHFTRVLAGHSSIHTAAQAGI